MAKEYRKATPNSMYGDELGFIAGYKQKTAEIRDLIKKLELARMEDDNFLGYNEEQDRKINLLKILL